MRNALEDAPRGVCALCQGEIALVDQTINQRTGKRRAGKWVHVSLPRDVHPARP